MRRRRNKHSERTAGKASGPGPGGDELREDASFELREDGSKELRE